MANRKPTFVFVPGGFCPGFYFHKVVDQLLSLGYGAQAIELPSIGRPSDPSIPIPSGYDDAAHVRSIAESDLNAGKDVIIVGNSYGGYVTIEASKGLAKADREAAGKKGGELKHLVLIGSLLPEIGVTVKDLVGGNIPVDLKPSDPSDAWIEPIPAAIAGPALCGSLPEEEMLYYAGMGKEMSAKAFLDPATYAAYEYIPTTVVIGELDKALDPKLQHESFDKQEKKGVKGLRKVVLRSDHCAMLTSPDDIVKVCLEAAV